MPNLNPLDHPICLSNPLRLMPSTAADHVPFLMFLVSALQPRILVELGTSHGVSYCAFCQAVKETKLDTRCYAVNTWQGEMYNDAESFKELKTYHDRLYGNFSSLIKNTFKAAAVDIENGTVDVLHIDGYHTYEAIKHDFETWLPKMSLQGVILFHNINVRDKNAGVFKLWEELRQHYPHFELTHDNRLGLLVTGSNMPVILRELLTASGEEQLIFRQFFARLGQNLEFSLNKEHENSVNLCQIQDQEQELKRLSATLNTQQETIAALSEELKNKEASLTELLNSRSWRLLSRLGRIKIRYFEPVYERLVRRSMVPSERREIEKGGLAENAELYSPLVPKDCWTDSFKDSVVLFPKPDQRQLSLFLEKQTPAPLQKPDIISFSTIDWDYTYQRPQQLMSQFAAHGHRVFLIKLKSVLPPDSDSRFSLREIKKNIYEVTLAAVRPPRISREIISGYHADSFLASLDDLRRKCHIDNAISYVMTPAWKPVALAARSRWGWKLIYDCMDDWDDFPGMMKNVTKGESALVRECDLLIVTASTLQEKWRKQREGASVLVRNGVDFEFYAKRCQPNALLDADTRPLIGYYGAIADWFDLELMIYIAEQRPHYSFVLIGGVFDVDVSKLKSLPNVKLLGQQPYVTMPQYLYHFDVCLIPFKLNTVTHATDPVKLYEYLCAGKPVVSAALAELKPFSEHLYIAQNQADFLEKLDEAVAEKDAAQESRRRDFARRNTWQTRYESIITAFSKTIPRASIIIVTYNNLAFSKLCLESIVRNTEYLNYEVIVVDNNSSDGTQAFLRQFAAQHPNIRLNLNSANHGFARTNNQGIAISTGERIVLLNNDTVVTPGWLSRLLKYLDDPQIGMVGPVTNFVGNEAKIEVKYTTWAEMEKFSLWRALENAGEVADISMLAMFCVALRRVTYDSIGPLDEQFGIGMFEDDDYSQRIKAAGYRVICATDVFVHHFGQTTFKTLIQNGEYEKLFQENRLRFEAKWKIKWIPPTNKSLMKTSNQ